MWIRRSASHFFTLTCAMQDLLALAPDFLDASAWLSAVEMRRSGASAAEVGEEPAVV